MMKMRVFAERRLRGAGGWSEYDCIHVDFLRSPFERRDNHVLIHDEHVIWADWL